jgi:hypothetical protein
MPHYGSGGGPVICGLSGRLGGPGGPARWQPRDTMRPAPAGTGVGARMCLGSAPPRRRPLRRDTRREQATRIGRPKRIFNRTEVVRLQASDLNREDLKPVTARRRNGGTRNSRSPNRRTGLSKTPRRRTIQD